MNMVAIGELIKTVGAPAEVIVTETTVTIKFAAAQSRAEEERPGDGGRRWGEKFSYAGETHSVPEWARLVGCSVVTARRRLRKYGSPYGAGAPSQEDAEVIAAS